MSRSKVSHLLSALALAGAFVFASTALTPYEPGAVGVAQDTLQEKADAGRIAGNQNAKVWVILVADFECPACLASFRTIDPILMKDYVKTGKIQIAFMNFPIRRQHPNSVEAANAAMCASAQGKFWEMHDALFETQERWRGRPRSTFKGMLDSVVTAVKVDASAWKSCMTSGKMNALIDTDESRLVQRGVDTTPSFIVDDQIVSGYIPPDKLRKMIDDALAKKGAR